MNSRLALITFLDGAGGHPDNTLPGAPPNYPSGGPVYPGGPVDPGYGHGHPAPPYPSGGPVWPGGPVDPGYGHGHPRPPYPTGGPVFPPVTPDNTLPDNSQPPQISLPIILPPSPVVDGEKKFELKYSVRFGWVLVAVEDETAQPK